MSARAIIVLLVPFAGAALAQSGLQPSTNLTVQAGTTLRIEGLQTLGIPPGAVIINDGVIEFDEQAALSEAPGFPISGNGVERTTRSYFTPMAGVDPAGLGADLTTAVAPGLLTLTRGHQPIIDNGGMHSIARWYDVDAATNNGMDAEVMMHYDPVELNGLLEPALTMHIGAAGNYWNALITTVDEVGNSASATGLDSLGRFTLFDGISTFVAADGASALILFPTLATEGITLLATTTAMRQVVVVDMLGRRMMATTMQGLEQDIDVRSYAAGRYAVLVDGIHAGSFVKQ